MKSWRPGKYVLAVAQRQKLVAYSTRAIAQPVTLLYQYSMLKLKLNCFQMKIQQTVQYETYLIILQKIFTFTLMCFMVGGDDSSCELHCQQLLCF